MNEEHPPKECFVLALDCGPVSVEELLAYKEAPAYNRAYQVWQAVFGQVYGGGHLSIRTLITDFRAYCVAYATTLPHATQLQVFRIMDRYRQQWLHDGTTDASFALLPEEIVGECFRLREEAMRKRPTAITLGPGPQDIGFFHEEHSTRLRVLENPDIIRDAVSTPQRIEPPFPSVPLFYQRDTSQAQPKKGKVRPLLEGYYLQQRLVCERYSVKVRRSSVVGGGEASLARRQLFTEEALLASVEVARKYHFADSAQALLAALMARIDSTAIASLPESSLFIECATPIDLGIYRPVAGLFFVSPVQAYQQYGQVIGRNPFAALAAQASHIRVLSLLKADGALLLNLLYDARARAWKLPDMFTCPAGACRAVLTPEEMVQQQAFTRWQLCPQCAALLHFFSRWFPLALLAIAGEFADRAEPEAEAAAEITETISRKKQKPGSSKYEEIREQVRLRVISFDACVKPAQAGRSASSEAVEAPDEEPGGPSWLDLAIEAGTVVYVRRSFGKSTRRLDPARNPRWKEKREVQVKGHDRRIPMTVANLQRTITRVVASKYEADKVATGEKEREGMAI